MATNYGLKMTGRSSLLCFFIIIINSKYPGTGTSQCHHVGCTLQCVHAGSKSIVATSSGRYLSDGSKDGA
ncbi:hypothetical protein EON65_01390 [archaeon]|nr:MAG: hypothetical protein EON65_01390 [archaeon]